MFAVSDSIRRISVKIDSARVVYGLSRAIFRVWCGKVELNTFTRMAIKLDRNVVFANLRKHMKEI